jgi:hypothetical protein
VAALACRFGAAVRYDYLTGTTIGFDATLRHRAEERVPLAAWPWLAPLARQHRPDHSCILGKENAMPARPAPLR